MGTPCRDRHGWNATIGNGLAAKGHVTYDAAVTRAWPGVTDSVLSSLYPM